MEGWFNRSFQYFSLEKDRKEFEQAQQWDGYKNYVINKDGYVIYTFDRKSSIRLDDFIWFISIGFIRITGWQCMKLLKELAEKYSEMEKQKITHGNLNLQTIWLVFEIQQIPEGGNLDTHKGCQLQYDYRALFYKVHFIGYSLKPQQEKKDENSMIVVFHSILGMMHNFATEKDKVTNSKTNKKPFMESVQGRLYLELQNGIYAFKDLTENYLKLEIHRVKSKDWIPVQHFKCMDLNLSEMNSELKKIRTTIIKEITDKSSELSDDFITNLSIDSQVRNTVISMLSQNSLYKGKEKAKSNDELKYESEQWRQFLLCPLGNQNQIIGLIDNYENQMKTELGQAFKFEIKVPIADIKQWIQEQFYRIWLLTLIEAQCLNSCSQFNNFIQSGVKIDYATINKKILTEYSKVHQQEFGKMIEDRILIHHCRQVVFYIYQTLLMYWPHRFQIQIYVSQLRMIVHTYQSMVLLLKMDSMTWVRLNFH